MTYEPLLQEEKVSDNYPVPSFYTEYAARTSRKRLALVSAMKTSTRIRDIFVAWKHVVWPFQLFSGKYLKNHQLRHADI